MIQANELRIGNWHQYIVRSDGILFNKRGKLMSIHISKFGYSRVNVVLNGIQKTYFLHRIVAETFIENPNLKPFVNHLNCIRNDNRVENLEWCTRQENSDHSWKYGGQRIKKVKRHPHCKEVICLRTGVVFDSIKEFSRSRHIRQSSVSKAVNHSINSKFDVVSITNTELEIDLNK